MLLLSRKALEEVVIGTSVTVKVMRITPQRVLLGVDAPPDTPVHRGEVANELRKVSGVLPSLANQEAKWLHTWEQGVYKGTQKCSDANLATMMNPSDASYNGVFYCFTDSPECPVA